MTVRQLALVVAVLFSVVAGAMTTQAGPYRVEVVTQPAIPEVGRATLIITVEADGKPVQDATVRALAQMPGMPMGEKDEAATPVAGQPGVYSAPAVFGMAGTYGVRVSITGPQGSAVVTMPLTTGQSTAQTGIHWSLIGIVVLLIGSVAIIFHRMNRTGQRIPVDRMFTVPVATSLVVLGLALAVAIFAINHYRRPGSMTPLEAQGMQMSTPAPEGITPVTLATAETEPFGASVRYTGQAVGFVEQDVMPRVTGTLIWMPFYVGDKVKKGQLIAKIDTSQLAPALAQSEAGLETAQQAVGVARSDFNQAQASVSEAKAEQAQYEGGLEEAQANLISVQEDRNAADGALASAKADLSSAQAGVGSAEADDAYFAKQATRADSLLAAGAISQEQAQRMHADAQKASVAVAQAHQAVEAGRAKVAEAQANIRKADAQTLAAKKRVEEAQSMLMSHHAHVATAVAAVSSAQQKISEAQAEANQAQAAVTGAAASKGYAEIKAETDGVITDRLISPGTLVNPGQAIVRIAQISPIRLQANVAEADLAGIRVGALVSILHRDAVEKPTLARVTSVAPSLDPAARTGMVEAVVANTDRRFLPGQFVTMQISLGQARQSLTIPSAAVHLDTVGEGSKFVWVAEAPTGGAYTVRRRSVQLGEDSGDKVAVLSGLKPGEQVVVEGGEDLADGQSASSQPSGGSVVSR